VADRALRPRLRGGERHDDDRARGGHRGDLRPGGYATIQGAIALPARLAQAAAPFAVAAFAAAAGSYRPVIWGLLAVAALAAAVFALVTRGRM
jgi:hypothetical protein